MELTLAEEDIDEIDLFAVIEDPLTKNIKNLLIEFTSSGEGINQLLRIHELQPLRNNEVIGVIENERDYRNNAPFPHQAFVSRPNICRENETNNLIDRILRKIGEMASAQQQGIPRKDLSIAVLSAIPLLENVASEINQFINYLYLLTAPQLLKDALKVPDNQWDGRLVLNRCNDEHKRKPCLNIYIPYISIEDKNKENIINLAMRLIKLKYKLIGLTFGYINNFDNIINEYADVMSEIANTLHNGSNRCSTTICECSKVSNYAYERVNETIYSRIAKPLEFECNHRLALDRSNMNVRVTIFVPTVKGQAANIGKALARIIENTSRYYPSTSLEIRFAYTSKSKEDAENVYRKMLAHFSNNRHSCRSSGAVRIVFDGDDSRLLVPPPSKPDKAAEALISFVDDGDLLLLVPEIPKSVILQLSTRIFNECPDKSSRILLLVPKKKVCVSPNEKAVGFFKIEKDGSVTDVFHRYSEKCLVSECGDLLHINREPGYCVTAPYAIAESVEVR